MKVKNIKSFIDFYKSIGVTIEIGKKQRKIKREDHFKFLRSPKKISVEKNSSLQVFHAGTTIDEFDNIITSGGRVLSIVAQGETFDKAFNLAYSNLKEIKFDGMHFRKDIGYQVRNI